MSQPCHESHERGTEPPNNTNIAWLYERCSRVRTDRMTPLVLASGVLDAIKSFEGDAQQSIEADTPYMLFKIFSNARARKDMTFVFDVSARALQIHGDPGATQESLREFHESVAGTSDGSGGRPAGRGGTPREAASGGRSSAETAETRDATAERPGSRGGLLAGVYNTVASVASYFSPGKRMRVEAPAVADESSDGPNIRASNDGTVAVQQQQPPVGSDDGSTPAVTVWEPITNASRKGLPDLTDDEICFQLRTRVLGLALPTFTTECWRYLQMAGWTYSLGQYHIPKGKSCGDDEYLDTRVIMEEIFEKSDLHSSGSGEQLQEPTSEPEPEEEGPTSFESPNDLVDYLDEFAMPDYRLTTAEVEARERINDARSTGYRRRNLRLRFALLQIAYRERNRQQGRKRARTSSTSRAAASKSRNGTARRSSVPVAQARETRRSSRLATNATEGSADVKSSGKAEEFNEAEQYFYRKRPAKKAKKDGIPSSGIKPAGEDIVVPTIKECVREVRAMHDASGADEAFYEYELAHYHDKFSEWAFYLATKQSILLYGLGSKRELLASFSDFLGDEGAGDVICLDGYDPSINLGEFLDVFTQLFCDSENVGGASMAERATACAKRYAATKTRPLYLLINNIDGTAMRSHLVQETLANLTHHSDKDGAPMIRIAASVDDVSASLYLWKPHTEAKFDWSWRNCDTYRPYFEEVLALPQHNSEKKSKRIKTKYKSTVSSALAVLKCIAPRHTEVLQVLARLQNTSSSKPTSYSTLKEECVKKMLTSSDTALKGMLKELVDHKIIVACEGRDPVYYIPHHFPLQDILTYKA